MLDRLRGLWASQRLLLLAFLAVVAVTLWFGVRAVSSALYWMDPAHQNQALEGWMTRRYVAMSYQVPPDLLAPALFALPGSPPDHRPMAEIAAANGLTLAELQARVEQAATIFREGKAKDAAARAANRDAVEKQGTP